MNAHSVEKIGGTSIAATDVVLANVLIGPRSEDALYGRVFVVSAFAGITNLLLEHKKSGAPGVYTLFANAERASRGAWREGLEKALSALRNLNEKTFSDPALRGEADALAAARIEEAGARLGDLERLCGHGHFRLDQHLGAAREMLASIGEAHSALVLTLLLRARGVTARFVDLTGWDDSRLLSLDERIAEAFAPIDPARELPIVTGYAKCSDGLIAAYGRGYTEVVFARVAAITGAAAAIIHKEFHLSSADPLLVGAEAVRKIGKTNYDVADQLANIGMEAVHPRAARSLRHARIPLQVRNTFDPSDAGTVISADFVSAAPRVEIVAGIKNVTALELLEHDMVGVKGYDSAILDALTRHNVRIVSKASNANTITHHVAASPKRIKRVVADLETRFANAIVTTRPVALVCVIGSDLNIPGITARAAQSLADAGVPILGVQQISRRVDIQFVVEEGDYDRAIRALHYALVEAPAAKRLAA